MRLRSYQVSGSRRDRMSNTLRNLLFFALALAIFLLLAQPVVLAQTDRDALISLYNATGGDSWSDKLGWKDAPTSADGFNEDPCTEAVWYGVTCTGDSVTELILYFNQLTGKIPAELANLSNLGILALDSKQLVSTQGLGCERSFFT